MNETEETHAMSQTGGYPKTPLGCPVPAPNENPSDVNSRHVSECPINVKTMKNCLWGISCCRIALRGQFVDRESIPVFVEVDIGLVILQLAPLKIYIV